VEGCRDSFRWVVARESYTFSLCVSQGSAANLTCVVSEIKAIGIAWKVSRMVLERWYTRESDMYSPPCHLKGASTHAVLPTCVFVVWVHKHCRLPEALKFPIIPNTLQCMDYAFPCLSFFFPLVYCACEHVTHTVRYIELLRGSSSHTRVCRRLVTKHGGWKGLETMQATFAIRRRDFLHLRHCRVRS
jgi:hypothetical protein